METVDCAKKPIRRRALQLVDSAEGIEDLKKFLGVEYVDRDELSTFKFSKKQEITLTQYLYIRRGDYVLDDWTVLTEEEFKRNYYKL